MTSEFYEFEEEGRDNTARRKLFGSFIGLVAREEWCDGMKSSQLNIDLEQNRHFAGFRKSAGIWYNTGDKMKCWDRRLVLWLRAQSGSYLPFFDENGDVVTVQGKKLEEAAVCTLEVVLRNTASYTVGFLLVPRYKRNQEPCISTASSWSVIGYFPYPAGAPGTIKRVTDCVTDYDKVKAMLLAHLPSHDKSSARDSMRDGDLKPSLSVTAHKRTCNAPSFNQNKRRLIQRENEENMEIVIIPKADSKVEKREPEKRSSEVWENEMCTKSCSSSILNKDGFVDVWSKDQNEPVKDDGKKEVFFPCDPVIEDDQMFSEDYSCCNPPTSYGDSSSLLCEDEKEDDTYNTGYSDDMEDRLLDGWHISSCDGGIALPYSPLSGVMMNEPDYQCGSPLFTGSNSNSVFMDVPNGIRDSLYPNQDTPSVYGFSFNLMS